MVAESPIMDVVGEVIESSSAQFRAECARLHEPPELGSFVMVVNPGSSVPEVDDPFESGVRLPDGAIFAVVSAASTGSIDSGRRPTAYWKDEASLRQEQPQIFQLLATEFTGLIVGHAAGGRFRPGLPPRPVKLHAPVAECGVREVTAVTERLDFLRNLAMNPLAGTSDELVAAALRHAAQARPGDKSYLVLAGKELARVFLDDYNRLKSLLDRIVPA